MDFIPFTNEFCVALEYYLSEVFKKSNDELTKGFWCDGVLVPSSEKQLEKKSVNDTRKIETIAFVGLDGQTPYELIVYFGKYSLRRYARGSGLDDCLPNLDEVSPITIDIKSKKIELYLL
jgi:hypothetical protein